VETYESNLEGRNQEHSNKMIYGDFINEMIETSLSKAPNYD
jgi:hypothetical protein